MLTGEREKKSAPPQGAGIGSDGLSRDLKRRTQLERVLLDDLKIPLFRDIIYMAASGDAMIGRN